jgi:hypothetical protein
MQTNDLKMNTIDPFDYVIGLGMIGTTISLIPDMSEGLRFILLLITAGGAVIKLWEQVKKSEHFKNDMVTLWKKIRKREPKD